MCILDDEIPEHLDCRAQICRVMRKEYQILIDSIWFLFPPQLLVTLTMTESDHLHDKLILRPCWILSIFTFVLICFSVVKCNSSISLYELWISSLTVTQALRVPPTNLIIILKLVPRHCNKFKRFESCRCFVRATTQDLELYNIYFLNQIHIWTWF